MKKVIIGIFAHPDDEAFLPSGSFIKWVDEGADLHLICATKGENGQNPDGAADLGAVRQAEWRRAGELMGASSQVQLGFPDGGLSNNLFHKIAAAAQEAIEEILQTYSSVDLDLVTYENQGITGHLDHVAMSLITTYLYKQLQQDTLPNIHKFRLLYACACEATSPQADTSFVFMPKGHTHSEIDITEDVSPVLERKKQVMHAHVSQRADAEAIISRLGNNLAYEHFNLFKD